MHERLSKSMQKHCFQLDMQVHHMDVLHIRFLMMEQHLLQVRLKCLLF